MLTPSAAIAHEQVLRSREGAYIQAKPPLLVSVTMFVILTATVFILGVVTAARAQTLPQLPDLPQAYLPGSLLPKEASCYQYTGEPAPRCSMHLSEHEVYFTFDAETRTVTQSLIPARDYTIGEIMAAWGTPTGITRKATMVYVRWGARSALLYTRSFQPDNPVEFIQYDLEPLPASPWRGFRLFE